MSCDIIFVLIRTIIYWPLWSLCEIASSLQYSLKKKTIATFSHSLPFNLDVAVFWHFCKSLELNLLLSEALKCTKCLINFFIGVKKSFSSWSHWWKKNYYCYFLNFLWIFKILETCITLVHCLVSKRWGLSLFSDISWESNFHMGRCWGRKEKGEVMSDSFVAANWDFLLIWNDFPAWRSN